MSVDATRLQEFCTYGLILISGTFQVFLAFVSLYNLLGWPAFVGVGIMVRRISTILTVTNLRVLDLLDTVEHFHSQHFKEPSAEANEDERQEDEDDVRTFEQHQEVGFLSSLSTIELTPLSASNCMRGIMRS